METLIQQTTRLHRELYEGEQGKLGAFAGRIVSTSPTSDELGVAFGPTPERRMPVQHPFSGQSSWLRSMPEVGALVLMQNRFDTGQPEVLKSLPAFSVNKAENYRKGLNVYRSLYPGEHDFASSGYAFNFMGRRGNLDLRSGASVKLQLSRESQELVSRSPTLRHELIFNASGSMGDESRLGVVKRWTSAHEEFYVKKNNNFVSESYLHLKNPAKQGPEVLLKRIEGHVYDDTGAEIKHMTTALPLRHQSLWYTTTDEFTRVEIDQNGNKIIEFPSTATTGYEVVIPEGGYRKVIGKNRDVTINQDEIVMVQKNVNYTVKQNVTYDVTKNIDLNAGTNRLFMDATSGSESANLTTKSSYGILASEASGGSLKLNAPKGTGLAITSTGATTLTAKQALTAKVDLNMNLEGKMLNANFDKINLGKGAAIPAVLGMALQAYVDQHTHTITSPGNPSTPPILPSAAFNGTPQSIISVKINLMGNV